MTFVEALRFSYTKGVPFKLVDINGYYKYINKYIYIYIYMI